MRIKKYFRAFCKYITDADYRFLLNAAHGKYDDMPDKEYLERKFKSCIGKPLDLAAPQTLNEKLQWLKLYNRRPEYTMMVDKFLVRDYIKEKLGEEYLIPLLGVWDNPDEIDFDALPNQFVLKCNHNSGLGMYICKDKSKLTPDDIKSIRRNLARGLAQDYYLTGREWPYKNVPRKVICEQYMTDPSGNGLTDYKFYCFNGKVKLLGIYKDRSSKTPTTADFFDRNYVWQDIKWGMPHSKVMPSKPELLEPMIEIAETLSQRIPEVRVDLYLCGKTIYFGELTFFDGSGFDKIEPAAFDKQMGDWLVLPAPYAESQQAEDGRCR